jgi:CDP-glucose 4,6-dehydratase
VEDLAMSLEFWKGKRVLVTGHTGFKGGWLSLWLADRGAQVHGYALQPPTEPNLHTVCGLSRRFASSVIADVRDAAALVRSLRAAAPEVVFHLAAQPLVRHSYAAPVETYATNVMGTVHLLDAVRDTPSVRAVVVVTTDKCYENHEHARPYSEADALGGFDPYSSSKACAELVASAYRRSFLAPRGVAVATARAGNVLGGGDWAPDRLVPDFLRAIDRGQPLAIRSPRATRPWQHVLEPLSGYLALAERLLTHGEEFAEAWNFGPDPDDVQTVQWIAEQLCARIAGASWRADPAPQPHEAHTLMLESAKAQRRLGWRPRWNLPIAMERTIQWHQAWKRGDDMHDFTRRQIAEFAGMPHSARPVHA